MASEIQTPLTTENTEITERFQVGPSEAIHSDPRALDPLGQLADVDLILLGRVSLLRILPSVISVLSVVIRSSYLPESSPRLSVPAQPCGRGGLAQFRLGDWQEINYLDHARGDTNPTRQRGDRRRHALASASVPRWRVGLVWPVFSVPVSMRSLETDRSLGDFRAAGRLNSDLVAINPRPFDWAPSPRDERTAAFF